MRAVNEMKPCTRSRSEILNLHRMRFESSLPTDVHRALRHVDTDTADSMNLIHGFQSHPESAPDIEPPCFRLPLHVFRNRTDATLEQPQSQPVKHPFPRAFKIHG